MKFLSLFSFSLAVTACRSTPSPQKSAKIDVHAHFVPDFYAKALKEAGHVPGPDGMPFTPEWDAETHLQFMKDNNIEKSILSISSPGVYLNVPSKDATKKAIKLARRVNQYGSQVKAKYPKQFGFFASLPLPDINASLKEIDYLFKQLNPKPDGVVMMSNYYGLYLGDRDLEPIYDALNELNVTIFEHPTTPCTQFNKLRFDIDKSAPSISQQQWQALNRPVAVRQFAAPTLDFPFETARTFADLFYTSMPTKFPNLKWIMSHAGGGLIPTLDRIVTYSDLYPGLNLTEDSMKQTLSESFYFNLAGPWPVNFAIPALLRWVDYTRIVWGSDTVFTPMSSAAKYAAAFDKDVEELFPDPRKANAIRATNARGLFG
ncbi:2-amino-3-carboxymuconate-6-semialdehyde decarboxylase [Fusarium phyllophilum]|uniref:6-methylsalicylate decarboxylase n=1 Tax=Fusarium phyllophilum TaxID=47803 RepID=A0A8H5JCG0_9HYPO|nr:2-amino-3-carboxymuconate-6-semialdehyde decarboxylase [Fusarium phyllophilum]